MPVADFKQVLEVDLVAPLILPNAWCGDDPQALSKIINMCSMMSIYGRNTVAAYASAKED